MKKQLYCDFMTGLVPVKVVKGSAEYDSQFRRWYVDVVVTRDGGGEPWGGCADVQYKKGERLTVPAAMVCERASRDRIRTVWEEEWKRAEA